FPFSLSLSLGVPARLADLLTAGDPGGAGQGYAGDGRRLDGERGEVFAFEVMDVLLAARASNHRQFHVQRLEVVAHAFGTNGWLESLFENDVLRGHAHRAPARMAVMAMSGRRAEVCIVSRGIDAPFVLHVTRCIAAEREEHALPDRHRVRTQRQRLGAICSSA